MPAVNPRISITLEPALIDLLTELASLKEMKPARLAKELLLTGLELEEDKLLSAIADARDTPKAKRIKHANAWK